VRAKLLLSFPDGLRMEEARDQFLAANGLSLEDYIAPTFTIGMFGVPFRLPSTRGRRRDVPLHDLHHVLTGFATDWPGEAEIGIWEIRTRCRSFAAYFLNGSAVMIGLFLCPRRVWQAFRTAKGKRNLYYDPAPYAALLQMTVGELRSLVGIESKE
jgi:hypothetical protein